MKASKKIALITAAVCLIGGIIISLTAFANMNYDITKLDTFVKETNEVVIRDKFNSINIDDTFSDIRLLPSADKKCMVVFHEGENIHHKATVNNNTLDISCNDTTFSEDFLFSGFFFHKISVELYLPEKEYNSLDINLSSGDIKVDDAFWFKSVSFKNHSGDISFNAGAGSLALECSSGDIILSGVKADDITAECSSGDIDLTSIECKNIDSQCSSGDIQLKNVVSADKLSAKTSSGDIELRECDGKNVELEATSGDIEGTFLTGKKFDADNTSGDISIPDNDSTSDSLCRVRTTSGDIKLSICKK